MSLEKVHWALNTYNKLFFAILLFANMDALAINGFGYKVLKEYSEVPDNFKEMDSPLPDQVHHPKKTNVFVEVFGGAGKPNEDIPISSYHKVEMKNNMDQIQNYSFTRKGGQKDCGCRLG